MENSLFLFLVRPTKNVVDEDPVFVIIAKDEAQCWELVYQDFKADNGYLQKEGYKLTEKIQMPPTEKPRIVWGATVI